MNRRPCLRRLFLAATLAFGAAIAAEPRIPERIPDYSELLESFASPDHARWGEVPLWWWEGDRLTPERVTWELETLAAKGVKAVCPIQRSPGRCDPPSFSDAWWEMFEFVHAECKRLGMTLWAYDQVGYGQYGWLEKAAAKAGDERTRRIAFLVREGGAPETIRVDLPRGELIAARAYPLEGGQADDARSADIRGAVKEGTLEWSPASGVWRVAVAVAVPYQSFQLSGPAADTFIDMLYGGIERRLGEEAMGSTFVGVFQDEHPPTPRDVHTQELAETFRQRAGYGIGRAIPALHFDVGPLTPKYRTDFFDAYLDLDERRYWKKVYEWTAARGLLTSHDNWGRNNIYRQSQGYIDYFRTQRWFSAPGYDDYGQAPIERRNYYDTKIAASIARLYRRPRVWNEAFHSSGWGRTTEQTLTWLSADYAFGANLYDEHGLYYSTRASTWEHAAPDPHWRQPYWRYYRHLSDWVARMSYLMSQGVHVVDVAVHYPVVSLLAGEPPGTAGPDYNTYMRLSRAIYDAGMDNDIADDDSIANGAVADGQLIMAGNGYRALVFGPETTVRRRVLRRALELAESGGAAVFFGRLPSGTAEAGRGDPKLAALLERLLGPAWRDGDGRRTITKDFASGGFAAFLPSAADRLPRVISEHIDRDFTPEGGRVFVNHRRIGSVHVYLVQNASPGPMDLRARCRVDGIAEIWDPFTGEVQPVNRFERRGGCTVIRHRLEGHTATLLVIRPGEARKGGSPPPRIQPPDKPLSDDWTFSVLPTRHNRWGEFRWPPSDEVIGPEVRSFRYAEETRGSGVELGWHLPDFDDSAWATCRASIGPYWLALGPIPARADIRSIVERPEGIHAGAAARVDGHELRWRTVEFSKTIGLARPAPWGGHSGYPDGAIDQNFIELAAGRKVLFTRIRSPEQRRLGLRVELRNSGARLWVNGIEQPFEGAIGNLPLRRGENTVWLDLPDGGRGMLFVQAEPPSVSSMEEAARGLPSPDLGAASWIWAGNTSAAYVRKAFQLERAPGEARLSVTAYTGYRLFVNGVKIEEEIGPWANWKKPESFNVARHLRAGENVIAVWGQVHADLGTVENRGLILALKTRDRNGKESALVTDASWKGSGSEQENWTRAAFDDSAWEPAAVRGPMGSPPWGSAPLDNLDAVTEPRRRLAIDLPSPYLECFNEVPDIAYDVKRSDDSRIGWYRFRAPPGLRRLTLGTPAKAEIWVDGVPASAVDGRASMESSPRGVSTVAIRLEMRPGAYGGAAFPRPIGLDLGGGTIHVGEWSRYALPTYSGIGIYEQDVRFTAREARRRTLLDLGQVLVAAEVMVNGESAGVRLASPFKFDLTGRVREGSNALQVRVANTIAPHYTVTNRVANLGPTASGLMGPVSLRQELADDEWKLWARDEITRLRRELDTSRPELEAAQQGWETDARWEVLRPEDASSASGLALRKLRDGSFLAAGDLPRSDVHTVAATANLTGITGFRLELLPRDGTAKRGPGRPTEGGLELKEPRITAALARGARLRGRYVRVEIPDRAEYLALAEVQAFSGAENVAPQGKARQSATSAGGFARLAVDGNTDGDFFKGRSVTHTPSHPGPWWELDLGADRPLDRIVIWNRTDGNLQHRLRGFLVSVLDASRKPVWRRFVAEPPDPAVTLDPAEPTPVALRAPRAGSPGAGHPAEPAGGGDAPSAWRVRRREGVRQAAIFETRGPLGSAGGTRLTFKVKVLRDATGPAALRLRWSATQSRPPLFDVPPEVERILATPADRRSERERKALAAYYRSIAPENAPARNRLRILERQMVDATPANPPVDR